MPKDLVTLMVLTVFFLGYGLMNAYVIFRARALWFAGVPVWVCLIALLVLVMAFPLLRILGLSDGCHALQMASFYWMGFVLLALCSFLAADVLWFVAKCLHAGQGVRQLIFLTALVLALGGSVYGFFNARDVRVTHYQIEIEKAPPGRQSLRAVVLSDLHLWGGLDARRLEHFVEMANAQNPDIVFIPGDFVDCSTAAFECGGYVEVFKKLKAPLGVYVVTGNHDFFERDARRLPEVLKTANVDIVDERVTSVENSFYIAGRIDKSVWPRKKLSEILAGLDPNKPLILLDHQPVDLDKAAALGVDLQLSGHTHGGQIFPGNIVTRLLFDNHYGLLKNGAYHSIVTSGAGYWGPPYRVGSISEIVVVDIAFKKEGR